MAKDYKKGQDYTLHLNTGTQGTPTWVKIIAVADIALDVGPSDIVVPVQGLSDGHLAGYGDPAITFTLFEDAGDANVETLIAAIFAKQMKEIAISNAPLMTTSPSKNYRLESAFIAAPLAASKGEPASFAVEARRHANSDFDLTRNLVA
jgi:hypothetical protein